MKKYSDILKDEAVKLAAQTSLKHATKITGVPYWSIRKHGQRLRAAKGIKLRKAAIPSKYTKAQRKECERIANNLLDSGMVKIKAKAWIMAGLRIGVDGRSMMLMNNLGLLYAPFNTQQPSGGSSGIGSVKTAMPQA